MKIEFITRRDFNLLTELSSRLGCVCESDTLKLPENFGDGFIRMIDLEPGLKLVMHRHKLKEELTIKRNSSAQKNNLVTITFNSNHQPAVSIQGGSDNATINLSPIYITSTDIGIETTFPVNQNISSTIIIIHSDLLFNLLEAHNKNGAIKSMTNSQSFWYDSNMTPKIREIIFEMDGICGITHFDRLYYRIKIQQLIYELFVEILENEDRPHHSIKPAEIEKIYRIRDEVLTDLHTPPLLSKLARTAAMSETRMKLLFRQIFGKSIYNYYQSARIEEAARLLKNFSVAETGIHLGFSNMSYFSKLFKKHHGMNPKKFKTPL